ncbi:MAG: hypothetical protein K9M82_06055 [Deltaproteobacteria bacterium]|nr:hypothetical protein [Deltaproteobacteria bacterium]
MPHHDKPMKDKDYDLVSTLYHALQGVEKSDAYLLDAEKAGDQAVTAFFQETRQSYRDISEKAKALLAQRIG